MNHVCHIDRKTPVTHCAANHKYWCNHCRLWHTRREVSFVKGSLDVKSHNFDPSRPTVT